MVLKESKIDEISKLLKTACDPTRIKIMFALLDIDKCSCNCNAIGHCSKCTCLSCMIEKKVNDIALEVNASQSLVSHQLRFLKDSGFVKSRKEGTSIFYSLKDGHIKELLSLSLEHIEEAKGND